MNLHYAHVTCVSAWDVIEVSFWLAIGPQDYLKQLIHNDDSWGFSKFCELHWSRIKPGDSMIFYAQAPVKGLVGFGKVGSIFEDYTPHWERELLQNRAIWPLRLKLQVIDFLPYRLWREKSVSIGQRGLQRPLQRLSDSLGEEFILALQKAMETSI